MREWEMMEKNTGRQPHIMGCYLVWFGGVFAV